MYLDLMVLSSKISQENKMRNKMQANFRNILKLYQYRTFCTEAERGYLSDYLSQKIWLTSLNKFNDPFEGKFTPKNFLSEEINGKKIVDIFSEHGAICFTDDPENIPMWAYYAKNHTGYCLVFELDFDEVRNRFKPMSDEEFNRVINLLREGKNILSFCVGRGNEFVLTKVKYQKEMPALDYVEISKKNGGAKEIEYITQNSVGVKFLQWKHEQEFRLISNTPSENVGLVSLEVYVPFLRVTGIILGKKMPDDNKEYIYGLCRGKEIDIYQAVTSSENYKINIERCTL